MFEGRRLVIATMHQKEKAIAPILEKELGVSCFVPGNFNTDELGTFSGETPRVLSQLETVRKKCLLAMEITQCDLGVASEGSFGPHPTLFFVPANDELLILIDKKNDFEIIARKLSTETNFSGEEINSEEELLKFAKQSQFPSHGILLKTNKEDNTTIIKDFRNWEELKSAYQNINRDGNAFVETDMRAMNNPTRMSVIEEATAELVQKITSLCPSCDYPGYAVSDSKPGLPCENCSLPTNSTLSHIYKCKRCNHQTEKFHPNGKTQEEAMFCNFCNP